MKTYDIINAGPRNRFLANGKIVSNSGRLVQMQNLPQNHISDLELAREIVRDGDLDMLEMAFGNVPDTLSQLIRTAFVAPKNKTFGVFDFSAIEARVIAWCANEKWRLEVFSTHGKIYEASASKMFNIPLEQITKGSDLRQKGKVAELACIAKGELVLTNRGPIPIEFVHPADYLWDGVEWVPHQGVIYKGEREVLTYQGLTATEDHLVFVELEKEPVMLKEAVNRRLNLKRVFTNTATDFSVYYRPGVYPVYDILNAGPRNRFTVSDVIVHNCGYGGGPGALINMGAIKMGLKEEDLQGIIDAWRAANPAIVKFWKNCEIAAVNAVNGQPTAIPGLNVKFYCKKNFLFIELPSGRCISYYKPHIKPGKFGGDSVAYWGTDSITKKWKVIDSYGGKWVENIVQAIARDCLAETLLSVNQRFFDIVAHVHDEIVVELDCETAEKDFEVIKNIMGSELAWAKGLPLTADGYLTKFYKKD